VPVDVYRVRAAIAARLTGPQAQKTSDKTSVGLGETFDYLLVYRAGDSAHTVTISDDVPPATTVMGASASKAPAPTVLGQSVTWTAPVVAQETVTLTIQAQAAASGVVTNTATFSGTQLFSRGAAVFIYQDQVYLPIILRSN
jgi:hypothetical protein